MNQNHGGRQNHGIVIYIKDLPFRVKIIWTMPKTQSFLSVPRLPCISIAYRGIVQFKTFFPPVKISYPPVENVYEAPVSVKKTTFSHWIRFVYSNC